MGPDHLRTLNSTSYFPNASTSDLRIRTELPNKLPNKLPTRTTTSPKHTTLKVPYSEGRAKSLGYLPNRVDKLRHKSNHIMPELLYDLSRAGSHISLDFSSSEDEFSPQVESGTKKNASGESRCIVRPNLPKIILLNRDTTRSQPKQSAKSETQSPNKQSRPEQMLHSTHRLLIPKTKYCTKKMLWTGSISHQNSVDSSSSASLPRRYSARAHSSHSILPNRLRETQPGSVEDFMNDASLNLSREEYDPYGLARRNFRDLFNESHPINLTTLRTDSRTSSGQFSFSSNHSVSSTWTLPRAFDRRRRRNNDRPAINTAIFAH